MLKRARGKFRGKLARRQLLRKGGGLSRVERAEVGRALGLCFHAQGIDSIARQRKRGNAAGHGPSSRTICVINTRAGRPVSTFVMTVTLSRADLRAALWKAVMVAYRGRASRPCPSARPRRLAR